MSDSIRPAPVGLTRRHLLRMGAWGALAAAAPLPVRALSPAGSRRELAFYNNHTGESLRSVYWEAGAYDEASLAEIDRQLHDTRTRVKEGVPV